MNGISHQILKRRWWGMKKNEFRISEVAAGSFLLMGDAAVFSFEGGFLPTARFTIQRGAGRGAKRPGEGSPQDQPRDGRRRSWALRRSAGNLLSEARDV